MKTIVLIFGAAIMLSLTTLATVIEVPNDQSTIQQAIEVANPEDTVLVAPGVYFENINFIGKNITVASHFILNNEFSFVETTTINGSLPLYADTASCVLFVSGEDSTAVLTGFTLTGGTGTVWEDEHNPNYYYTEGGGILIQYSSPTIRNNIIIDNEAIDNSTGITSAGGGAIRAGDSNPHILNNMILYNQGRYGAGIVLNFSGAVIKNNIIAYNYGGEDYGGGGIWCVGNGDDPKIIENNTIFENTSLLGGGGIRIWSANVNMTNCILWGNISNSGGQIQGNGVVTFCNIEGGYGGEGNIDEDPLFEPLHFILADGSPCIDMGNLDMEYYDPEDPQNPGFALYPAKGELTNDMGAYGGTGCLEFPNLFTSVDNKISNTSELEFQVYPNPVIGNQFEIDHRCNSLNEVWLQIYNCEGKVVFKKMLENPREKVELEEIRKGVYFVKLSSKEGLTKTKKILVY